jgi:hypothetical protein
MPFHLQVQHTPRRMSNTACLSEIASFIFLACGEGRWCKAVRRAPTPGVRGVAHLLARRRTRSSRSPSRTPPEDFTSPCGASPVYKRQAGSALTRLSVTCTGGGKCGAPAAAPDAAPRAGDGCLCA